MNNRIRLASIASFLSLSAIFCLSCSASITYRFNDRGEDTAYIYRNGDLINDEKMASDYATATKEIDEAGFIELLDIGEDFMFIHRSESCSVCENFEAPFSGYVQASLSLAYSYSGTFSSLISALGTTYGGNLISTLRSNSNTPGLFFVNIEDDGVYLQVADQIYTHYGSSTILGDYLYPLYSTTNVYRFSDFAALDSLNRNGKLVAVMDLSDDGQLSFWVDSLRDYAIHGEKELYLVDYSLCSDDDKQKLISEFSLKFNGGSLLSYVSYGENIVYGRSGAISVFEQYYS
ncbi:MAG: hypothetical protein Q4F15_02675 [Bacillota bacterium]|nr:hypothetical protein [Bacillota bacterium]